MTATHKLRRRWFRYSLRTLLLVMFLTSTGLSWFGVKLQQARRQRGAVEAIRDLGGYVEYDWQVQQLGNPFPGARVRGPAWLRNLLGEDLFTTVVGVSFLDPRGTQVTDAGLQHLKGLTQLRTLNLKGTQVTDEGVKRLQERLRRRVCLPLDAPLIESLHHVAPR